MTTIQLKGIELSDPIFKMIYKDYLTKDSQSHFVYWANGYTHKAFIAGANILMRLNSPKVIKALKKYLDSKELQYDEYEYPFPRGKYQLGLHKKNWESRHLEISLLLDHLCSKASMELSWKEWQEFLSQVLHIACNTRGVDYLMQARLMLSLSKGSLEVLNDWTHKSLEQSE